MVTIRDLYEEAERFLNERYGINLMMPITVAELPDDIQGYYEHRGTKPSVIVIARDVMTFGSDEHVYDILRHELVHYAMHVLGRPNRDGDAEFEAELERQGVCHSFTSLLGRYHMYACSGCSAELPSRKRFSEEQLRVIVTACCEKPAIDLCQQNLYNGKERVY